MSSPKRISPDPIDQALRHRLRKWAVGHPLPENGRVRLLRAALLTNLPVEKPAKVHHIFHSELMFNWTATYLAGDKLLNLRLVS
jgi:hypothetical protein